MCEDRTSLCVGDAGFGTEVGILRFEALVCGRLRFESLEME